MGMTALGEEPVRAPFRRPVMIWLAVMCLLILAMVVVGGITRLTGSGLSIVEWRPVTGALPPLSDQDWQEAFDGYRRSPEYRLVNAGMDLGAFKQIYAWEYVHRLLGRAIGLAFFVPWAWFMWRRALSRALSMRLLGGLALGGLQGAVGWLMVASGLRDVPHVSHYRLAAHLSMALVVLGYLFWIWLDLRGAGSGAEASVRAVARGTLALIAAQIVYGALTAGLHAGIGYNTFPTMHGAWLPPGGLAMTPAWRNAFENPATVQFIHRVLGASVGVSAATLGFLSRRSPPGLRRAIGGLALVTMVQFGLGVATLLLVVPIALAVVHQLGACVLLLTALHANHEASR